MPPAAAAADYQSRINARVFLHNGDEAMGGFIEEEDYLLTSLRETERKRERERGEGGREREKGKKRERVRVGGRERGRERSLQSFFPGSTHYKAHRMY